MKTRTLVGLAAVAGLHATVQAQPDQMTWVWIWVHIEPGTANTIVPQVPGIISPGEGVEIRGSFSFNAPIGVWRQSYHPGMSGFISGLANTFIDFHASPGHGGMFDSSVTRLPAASVTPEVLTDSIRGIKVGQTGTPGLPLPSAATSFPNAVRIRWSPSDYTPRQLEFWAVKSALTQGTGAVLYLNAGDTLPGQQVYVEYQIEHIVGAPIQIGIVPGPSSLALLGLGGIVATRRHRRPRTNAVAEQALSF